MAARQYRRRNFWRPFSPLIRGRVEKSGGARTLHTCGVSARESVSIQSVSLALQSLRGTRLSLGEIMRKLRAESLTGIVAGMCECCAVSTVAWLWLGDWRIVVCLLGGIFGGVTFAAVVGLAMPVFCD